MIPQSGDTSGVCCIEEIGRRRGASPRMLRGSGRGGYAATVRGGDRDLGAPVDRRLRLGAAQAAAADGRRGETLSRHRKCGRAGVRQDDGVVGIDGAADGIGRAGRSSSPRCRWCSHRRGRSCRSKPASTSRRRRHRGDNRDDASGPAGQPNRACLRPVFQPDATRRPACRSVYCSRERFTAMNVASTRRTVSSGSSRCQRRSTGREPLTRRAPVGCRCATQTGTGGEESCARPFRHA